MMDAQKSCMIGRLYKEWCKMQIEMQIVSRQSNMQAQVKCLSLGPSFLLGIRRTLLMHKDINTRTSLMGLKQPALVLETMVD